MNFVRSRRLPAFKTSLPLLGILVLAAASSVAQAEPAGQWRDAPEAKVLNNLVAELLRVESPKAESPGRFTFVNPRDGWVFVASKAAGTTAVAIKIDDEAIHSHEKPGELESMRLLPKGPHTLTISATAGLECLVVRSIPELIFARYGSGIVLVDTRANREPWPGEETRYDERSLTDILPNVNVLVGSSGQDHEPMLRQWKAQGKRWLVECPAKGISTKDQVTADDIQGHLTGHAGFTNPAIDGVIVDEFFEGEQDAYAAWIEAVGRIQAEARYRGKLVYPYCTDMYEGRASSRFIQKVIDGGWKFALERYLAEPPDAKGVERDLSLHLTQTIADWDAKMPGIAQHMIACMGTFSQPPENLDVNPAMDYKVFLDRQWNLLANDPHCFGLYGVMTYLSSYTEPEIVRWTGRLMRHYCIEGNTTMCSHDPLMLPHLANGDFEEELSGWQVVEAEPGSVAAKTRDGFSWLQGRYPEIKRGDTVLWMKRSAVRPNVVRQEIRHLEPGRLYTLRMCSGDYRDLAAQQKLAIDLKLDGVEVLPGHARQDVFPNCYSHHHGQFDAARRAWMNYHWILFRARQEQAVLEVSDWTGSKEPGGPVGQELMMNFVQVQPYEE
jgi:hypothetical protein